MSSSIETGGVHHLGLTVSDIDRSTEFYTRYLGFQFVVEFGQKKIFSNGSMLLALAPPPDPSQTIDNDRFNENRIGLDHVSFTVANLEKMEEAAAILDEHGVTRGEINDLGEGFAIYVMVIRDPDNIQLEITAPYGQ